jgi:uncharacterized phage protein (TIGR02220 family)
MLIQVNLTELASIDYEGLRTLKALVKIHYGQNMNDVVKDLDLSSSESSALIHFLVNGGGRQRLSNDTLGTDYQIDDVSPYVSVLYKSGHNKFEDYVSVIEDRAREWQPDRRMRQHLRPSTLFGKKFHEYLQLTRIQQLPFDQVKWNDEFTGV